MIDNLQLVFSTNRKSCAESVPHQTSYHPTTARPKSTAGIPGSASNEQARQGTHARVMGTTHLHSGLYIATGQYSSIVRECSGF